MNGPNGPVVDALEERLRRHYCRRYGPPPDPEGRWQQVATRLDAQDRPSLWTRLWKRLSRPTVGGRRRRVRADTPVVTGRRNGRGALHPGERDREAAGTLSGRLPLRRPVLLRAAAAALIGGLFVLIVFPWLRPAPSAASAAEVLNGLAAVAAAQPGPPAAQGGYRYLKSETLHLSMVAGVDAPGPPVAALVPKTREMWVAPDGSGRIREIAGEPIFLSDRARAAWEAAGRPDLATAIHQDFGPGGLWYEDFDRYPTDPAALAEVVRQRAEKADPPVDIGMFVVVGDMLREPGAPPELRAALYQVAARIPGVEFLGRVTDRAGRPGVAVAKDTTYWGGKQRYVLLFDPSTSALLGEERGLIEPVDWLDARPPVVIGHATYLESAVVPSLPIDPSAAPPRPVHPPEVRPDGLPRGN